MNVLSLQNVLQVILSLAFVLSLVVLASYLLRKFSQHKFMTAENMKIISQLPVGAKERILLLEIAGNKMLVGVTANAITTLHVFPDSHHVATPVSSS